MKTAKYFTVHFHVLPVAAMVALLFSGCQTSSEKSASQPASAPTASTATSESKPAAKVSAPSFHIKAGASESFTDSQGNKWLPEQGFADGDTVERPDLTIANTKDPQIYRSERYSMTSFSLPLPNGKYQVKLHFCETYEGITGPGQRVFSFNVAGREFKDFDVWVKAGGPLHAYVETVPVEIKDGKLMITFTPNVENPQINGIEIIPVAE
jgi:Malectin domain